MQADISKWDVLSYLKKSGYIEKIAAREGFYCTTKQCRLIVKSHLDSYGVPKSQSNLLEGMRKHSIKNSDGTYESISDVTRRCLICVYRAYRELFKIKFKNELDHLDNLDEDVLNDFHTNSTVTEKPIIKRPKPKPQFFQPSPQPQPGAEYNDQDIHNFQAKLMSELVKLNNDVWFRIINRMIVTNQIFGRDYFKKSVPSDHYVLVPTLDILEEFLAKHSMNLTEFERNTQFKSNIYYTLENNIVLGHILESKKTRSNHYMSIVDGREVFHIIKDTVTKVTGKTSYKSKILQRKELLLGNDHTVTFIVVDQVFAREVDLPKAQPKEEEYYTNHEIEQFSDRMINGLIELTLNDVRDPFLMGASTWLKAWTWLVDNGSGFVRKDFPRVDSVFSTFHILMPTIQAFDTFMNSKKNGQSKDDLLHELRVLNSPFHQLVWDNVLVERNDLTTYNVVKHKFEFKWDEIHSISGPRGQNYVGSIVAAREVTMDKYTIRIHLVDNLFVRKGLYPNWKPTRPASPKQPSPKSSPEPNIYPNGESTKDYMKRLKFITDIQKFMADNGARTWASYWEAYKEQDVHFIWNNIKSGNAFIVSNDSFLKYITKSLKPGLLSKNMSEDSLGRTLFWTNYLIFTKISTSGKRSMMDKFKAFSNIKDAIYYVDVDDKVIYTLHEETPIKIIANMRYELPGYMEAVDVYIIDAILSTDELNKQILK